MYSNLATCSKHSRSVKPKIIGALRCTASPASDFSFPLRNAEARNPMPKKAVTIIDVPIRLLEFLFIHEVEHSTGAP